MVNESLQKMFVKEVDTGSSNQNLSRKSTVNSTSTSDNLKSKMHVPKIKIDFLAMKNNNSNQNGGDLSDMFRDNKGRRTSILGIPAMQEEAITTHLVTKRSNIDRKFADLVKLVKEKDPERKYIKGKMYNIEHLNSCQDLYVYRDEKGVMHKRERSKSSHNLY